MMCEFFEEQAALFICGRLQGERREQFELLLRCDEELRDFTGVLAETAAPLAVGGVDIEPSFGLRDRVLQAVCGAVQDAPEILVMADAGGRVLWTSSSFREMCGYTKEELQGRKPGELLQGEKTDRATATRLGQAVKEGRRCQETILNYHKNGHPYWVEIALTPITDEAGRTIRFVAKERERKDLSAG